ncbi:uncharacterized protein [Spinacia oleracea]|uniref:Uncharacterized protein n=1 Tax=Spinacia oleracea TaxID=3562 RepID=A0ABM3RBY7_SPIOL|nr:uncharacterized protein LOC110789422 [Spinacia oleracea]XP_056693128.1 uncharacterized protein LOC110789422 [Spinacia oleracea]
MPCSAGYYLLLLSFIKTSIHKLMLYDITMGHRVVIDVWNWGLRYILIFFYKIPCCFLLLLWTRIFHEAIGAISDLSWIPVSTRLTALAFSSNVPLHVLQILKRCLLCPMSFMLALSCGACCTQTQIPCSTGYCTFCCCY